MVSLRTTNILFYRMIWLIAFIPSTAFALAGIGERTSMFHYNQYAELHWEHPGQFCDGDDTRCLFLLKTDNSEFAGLEVSFEEISLPASVSDPLILARRSKDNTWLVYDLIKESYLIEGAPFNNADAVWRSNGNEKAEFVDVENPGKLLVETRKSIKLKWALRAFWYLVPCILLSIVFSCLAFSSHKKYCKSKSLVKLILAITYTVLCGTTVVLASIFLWAIV